MIGEDDQDTLQGIDRLFGNNDADTFVLEPSTTNGDRAIIRDYVDGVVDAAVIDESDFLSI